ncbi:glycosyltransferase [uncultured Methylobacterium sp.]|uniref:glycosyltransferase n=1 Tax=uncultured Methylobacterium sp. TaxID=157278 RepID=UPI0035CB3A61
MTENSDIQSNSESNKRIFIVDPACVLPFGHAITALNHFREYCKDFYDEVICIASLKLDQEISASNNFERRFHYLYNESIPIMSRFSFEKYICSLPFYKKDAADPFESISTSDAANIIYDYSIGRGDTIFFPGADYYGLYGFISAVIDIEVSRRPRILIRFIGVLEGASPFKNDALSHILKMINKAVKQGVDIRLSAETPIYSNYISQHTEIFTYVTPYPETSRQLPIHEKEYFTILCAGSARIDKGFNHLFDIMKSIINANSRKKFRLVTQTLPYAGNEQWDSYTSQLYALKGVELLEPVISDSKMRSLYHQCDIVLLPYAVDVYKYRGSAVMMEAASIGRLCVTLSGSAFAQQVNYYNLGDVVDSISEIPRAVLSLADYDATTMANRIVQARQRFYLDVKAAYSAWFK